MSAHRDGDGLFARANRIPTVDVLDFLRWRKLRRAWLDLRQAAARLAPPATSSIAMLGAQVLRFATFSQVTRAPARGMGLAPTLLYPRGYTVGFEGVELMKYLVHSMLGLASIACCLAMTSSASAFSVYNLNSRLCLDVPPSGAEGNLAVQKACTGAASQQWSSDCVHGFCFSDGNGGIFDFLDNVGNALGVAGAREQDGTRLVAWHQTGEWNQAWGWVFVQNDPFNTANRCYQIVNAASPSIQLNDSSKPTYVMGVLGGSTASGASVVIWTNLHHADQTWCVQ